jgi:hypothetical protein
MLQINLDKSKSFLIFTSSSKTNKMKTLTVTTIAGFAITLIIGLMLINAGEELGFFFTPIGIFGLIITAMAYQPPNGSPNKYRTKR